MTTRDLIERKLFQVVNEGENLDQEITTPFCCDLLSIAMSHAPEGCVWVTVMANINTLAVASLTDAACVVLAEGVALDEGSLKKAREQKITVLSTELPIFQGALMVSRLLS